MLCYWLTTTLPVPADAPPVTHFVRPDALSVQQQKLLRLQPHVARAALRLVNLHHRRSLWLPALSVGHATAIASGRHAPQARAAAQTYRRTFSLLSSARPHESAIFCGATWRAASSQQQRSPGSWISSGRAPCCPARASGSQRTHDFGSRTGPCRACPPPHTTPRERWRAGRRC